LEPAIGDFDQQRHELEVHLCWTYG